MDETIIAFVSFFMLFFIIIVIRVGRRYKRFVKTQRKSPSLILFEKIWRSSNADLDCGGADCGGADCGDCDCGGMYCSSSNCDCCGCECESKKTKEQKEQEERIMARKQKEKEQKQKELEEKTERVKETEELMEKEFKTKEDEKKIIENLTCDQEETNLNWLSAVTMISKERIIEIVLENYILRINNENVINIELMEKEAEIICPLCGNLLEKDSKFCKYCGHNF